MSESQSVRAVGEIIKVDRQGIIIATGKDNLIIEELQMEGKELIEEIEEFDRIRLTNTEERCYDKWLENKHYSPDRAEKFRSVAREKLIRLETIS